MSLHFAYGRSTLSSADWSIVVNTGGGNLTGATKYFSLQAQNPIGKNLILASSPVTFATGDSLTFTINSTALTSAEGWTHYVIGISDTNTPSTFNQIARINIYDMSTGSFDYNTQESFPLSLTLTEDEQLTTGSYVTDKLSLPTTNLIYGMRRGVSENNYIYEYNPFSTLTANDDDVLSALTGVWIKKTGFSTYISSISQYGGCGYDIYHLTDFSDVELPSYNADGTNSLKVKYYLLNNSGFTLQPGTGFTLSAQIGGVERTELFDGKIYYRFKGVVTPTDGTLRTTSTISGQTLDFIEQDYVYTKANPVTITKDYIEQGTGIYFETYVNFLNLEFNNLLPDGYLQIFFSYISPKGVFTPVGTLFEKGIIYNKYNKRRVLPDTGLNVVVGEGEGLIKNFSWYSCNTSISGLTANTANQKLYVNINGVVFVDIAERNSSVLRAIVDTTVKESKTSTWTSYGAVAANDALLVTVDYECDSELNQKVRTTYPDVIADDWAIFNPTKLNIYVQRQSDGEIRKFTNFIPSGNNVSQDFTITDWSAGEVVVTTPTVSASFFDPTTNSFTSTASSGNFTSGNYRVAHTYVWNGDTVSDISHSVAEGCITESQITGEQVFGTTVYELIAQIKAEDSLYDGLRLYCKETQQLYVYDEKSTLTDDDNYVLLPDSGVGRWISTVINKHSTFINSVAPTVTNDETEGYIVGDKWLDTVEKKEYTLIDATEGAAEWGQVGGGAEVIELSENTTWYVAVDGDAEADGLTVDTQITLEEVVSRINRIDASAQYTVTLILSNGFYASDVFLQIPAKTRSNFTVKFEGSEWVGSSTYPGVEIFGNVESIGLSTIFKNIQLLFVKVENADTELENVCFDDGGYVELTGGETYCYCWGLIKVRGISKLTLFRACNNCYLELDANYDSDGGTVNFTQGFVRLYDGAILALDSSPVITGTFTGNKISYEDSTVKIDYGQEFITNLPGSITLPYPTYLVEPSNTLATTASLATVATSGSYNDLSDLPAIPTTAADITVDTTNLNNNLSGTDTTVQAALETLDELIASAGGGLTSVYTTDVTLAATAGNFYLLNGTTTVNLPAGVNGDRIGFADYLPNFYASPVTINPNGAEAIAGLANLTLDSDRDCIELLFQTDRWVVTSLESFADSSGVTTGSGLNLGVWDSSGTFTSGVRFDGTGDKVLLPTATTAERSAVTLLEAELVYDRDEAKFYYGDGVTLGGVVVGSGSGGREVLTLPHVTTPSAPASGNTSIYAKSDGKIYRRAAGGNEAEIGGGILTTITTKTGDYTANDGERIPCDTSGGGFTITTPGTGRFQVVDIIGTSPTTGFGVTSKNLTVTPASGTIMGDTTLVLDVGAISPEFELIGTDWRIVNHG